jgi:CTP synthase
VNNLLRKRLEAAGLRASGTSPDERLVEVVELDDHPFFVASQFHPEFKSRPERPAPLFREFIAAALDRAADAESDAEAETRSGGEVAAAAADAGDGEGRLRISDGRSVGLGRSDGS